MALERVGCNCYLYDLIPGKLDSVTDTIQCDNCKGWVPRVWSRYVTKELWKEGIQIMSDCEKFNEVGVSRWKWCLEVAKKSPVTIVSARRLFPICSMLKVDINKVIEALHIIHDSSKKRDVLSSIVLHRYLTMVKEGVVKSSVRLPGDLLFQLNKLFQTKELKNGKSSHNTKSDSH